jgi:cytochrome c oxidase assembly protein subunit 15
MTTDTRENGGPDRVLLGLCGFSLAWAVVVFQAGGFTTSIGAGMAFLDWPLSNGSVNPPGWLTDLDMFAEHSHRLAAAKFGLLLGVVAIVHGFREPRRGVRLAAYALAGLVVFQGLLGGARVMLDQLNTGAAHNLGGIGFGIAHAITAQLTVALLACLTLAHTRLWRMETSITTHGRRAAMAAPALLLAVMVAGAVMRQNRVTLWVTDGGSLFLPDIGDGWVWAVNAAHRAGALFLPDIGDGWVWAVNAAHRAGALVAVSAVAWLVVASWRNSQARTLASIVAITLAVQILLGILAIGLPANPHVRTVHVIVGAILFSSTCALALLNLRRPAQPTA